ncbi:hypothetical protein K501DRAFT_254646, partial [Backusella circina FSU 941]
MSDIINLTEDGQVTKRVLTEGKGTSPGKNDTISVHYDAYLIATNAKFDSSRDRKAEFTFVLNSNEVIKCWELVIPTMKVGEKVELITTSDYGYGDEGQTYIVPPKAKLRYELELIGHWEPASSSKERIAAAEKKKSEGNDLFKQGMTEQALFAYRKAREYIIDLWNCEPEETVKCRQLIVMIQLNIGACHLKLKRYDDAIEVCKRALDRDSASVKAYYRLAQAYLEKGEFQESLDFVNSGLQHRPSDPSLNALKELI